MGLAILVGIAVSAVAADAVTGLVAAVGAGGIVALRADADHSWKARAVAVALATMYTFVLLRSASDVALLMAPVPAVHRHRCGRSSLGAQARPGAASRGERSRSLGGFARPERVEERQLTFHGVGKDPRVVRPFDGESHVPSGERVFAKELDGQAGVDERRDDLAQTVVPAVLLLGFGRRRSGRRRSPRRRRPRARGAPSMGTGTRAAALRRAPTRSGAPR